MRLCSVHPLANVSAESLVVPVTLSLISGVVPNHGTGAHTSPFPAA